MQQMNECETKVYKFWQTNCTTNFDFWQFSEFCSFSTQAPLPPGGQWKGNPAASGPIVT
jgi:hypothetical protein